jgi:hypothetical protein
MNIGRQPSQRHDLQTVNYEKGTIPVNFPAGLNTQNKRGQAYVFP